MKLPRLFSRILTRSPALRKSDERYRSIFENSLDGMFISTPAGQFLAANHALIELLGYDSIEELRALNIPHDVYTDPAERIQIQARYDSVGLAKGIETTFKKKNGDIIDVHITSWMVAHGRGGFLYEGIVRDIAAEKLAEHQRLELARHKERIEFLRDFIGNISHDLRTPLTTITNSLYLISRYDDPARRQEKLDLIGEQVRLLDRYIQDMITMSQLDYTPALAVEKVDINRVVEDVRANLLPTAEKRQLTVIPHLDHRLEPINANYDQLRSLLTNLIENSLQYTLQGGVTVRTQAVPDAIQIEIADTGIGINPDDLSRIFDRFYRANNARSIHDNGTGLGLAIVKRIVELHGGTIEVESQPGVGSTFLIRLPTAR